MIRFDLHALRIRRRALGVLLSFVAAIGIMVATPFVRAAHAATGFNLVCSVHGDRLVSHDAGGRHSSGDGSDDHAAHCPLCMPVGAPPTASTWAAPSVQPLAHALRPIPAARLAGLVGAPLPARGPPAAS